MPDLATPAEVVERCDEIMSHAWMVRTFIKHSEEVEDFPELDGLMGIVRSVFDASRALETRVDDPAGYLKMLGKKIGKLKAAVVEFERDAFEVSEHTNFVMAVRSVQVCARDLEALLEHGRSLLQNAEASGTGSV
jgi:hypothetical protein